ncbi:Neur-chan-LBD domain-containing protein [Aphelenchoides fujianensis]|nr:Neur-chan-LBD domain-containing protein [Aphelenchoides fujianensis]
MREGEMFGSVAVVWLLAASALHSVLAMKSNLSAVELSTTSMLLNELFASYDRRIRPFAEEGRPVQIHLSIVLGILIDIRENEQIASYVVSHTMRWVDPRLRWRPREWNNTKEILAPLSHIWTPRVFVYNSMSTVDMLPDSKYDVRINSKGEIKINIPQYLEAICRLSIENFPFDNEYCAIALASPLLTVEEMECVSSQPVPDQSYFAGNAEWELVNVSARHLTFKEEDEIRAEVHYIFQFRRRAVFYIAVIVVPITLISALSLLGIFMPISDSEARNEKASLGLSSLLSMAVILGILAGALPKTNSLPLLGVYILTVIILCGAAVCISLFLSALSRRLVENGRVPSSFTYRLVCLLPKTFAKSRAPRHSSIFRPSLTVTLMNGVGKKSNASTTTTTTKTANGTAANGTIVAGAEDSGFQFADLAKIYRMIQFLAEEQRHLRRKKDRDQLRALIEREWASIFSRVNFCLLIAFELFNAGALLFFLQYAFMPAPPMREPLRKACKQTRGVFSADPSELLDKLLLRYDKRVRPFADEQRPVIIQCTIVLAILTELRENEQTAAFVISHVNRWTDPKLRWNKDEHNGLTQIFDVQFCAIAQASPLLNVDEMDVNATQPPKDSYFAGNAEWEILNVTVRQMRFMEEGEYRVEVHYILHLQRKPVYYVTVIVAPCFLICSLSLLGIFSPADDNGPRGEKVSLGLGSLLALVVLLDIVATSLPKSNSIPLLGFFIIGDILLVAGAVAVSTFLLSLNRKLIDGGNMPSSIAYTLALLRAPKHRTDYWQTGVNNSLDFYESTTITPPKFPDLHALFARVQEIAQAQNAYRKIQEKRKWSQACEREWNRVFSRLDYLMLFVFEAANIVVLILFVRVSWLPLPELPDDFAV